MTDAEPEDPGQEDGLPEEGLPQDSGQKDGLPEDGLPQEEEQPQPLRLHVHVNEPWAFERQNGVSSMVGSTLDHLDPSCNDWEVLLEQRFTLDDQTFDRVLVSPRYIGEILHRVTEDFVTAAIRIARFRGHEWQYEMTGTLAHQRDEKKV